MSQTTYVDKKTDLVDGWEFPVLDFTGGLNTKSSPYLLGRDTLFSLRRNQLPVLQNLDRNESGALTTREGRTKLNTSAVVPAAGTDTIQSIYEYIKSNGTSYIIINAGGSVYKLNGTVFDLITAGLTVNLRSSWLTMNDTLVMANGVDVLKKYDGTTWANLGGTPPAGVNLIVKYREHIIASVGTQLYYTAIGTIEDWTTSGDAGNIPIPVEKGIRVTAMIPFFDRLIIFTDREIFAMIGTDDDTFRFIPISYVMGHTGSHAGVTADGNEIFFQNEAGISRLYVAESSGELASIEERYASAVIEPTWQGLNINNMPNRIVVNNSDNSTVLFICGNDTSSDNNIALAADLYHKDPLGNPTWGEYTNYPFHSAHEVVDLIPGKRKVLLGGYDGYVYVLGGTQDDGINIQVAFKYITDMDSPQWIKLLRWMILFVVSTEASTISQEFTISATADFGTSSLTSTPTISVTGSKRLGVNWVLGVDKLLAAKVIIPQVSIPLHGRYMSFLFTYASSSRLTFNGFILYGANRRLIL